MLTPVLPTACVRARESASAQLDGELTELETLRLEAHLRDCPACSEFAAASEVVTVRLRAAALERPRVRTFSAPRRPAVRMPRAAAAGAAAAAAAVAAATILVGQVVRGPSTAGSAHAAGTLVAPGTTSVERWRQMLALLPPSDRRLINLHVTRWAT